MKRVSVVVLCALVLTAMGCAKPPTDKVAAAEQAVSDAREAGGQAYMAEDYAKLEGMLANAKKEIADQDAKIALTRDYEKAEQLLVAVQTDATRVKAEAGKKKEEAKAAALQAQQAAQAAVKRTQELVAKAPVGKDRAAVESIKADAQGLNASLAEVQAAMDAGDYLSAQTKAKAIQDKAQAVAGEIQTALAKVAAGKGKKKGK
jgi:hypothetical protein